MATFVSKDCKAWIGRYALHGYLNALGLDEQTEPKEDTRFGSATRTNKPGLQIVAASYAGLFESDGTSAIDDAIQAVRGVENTVVSLAPTTGAVGERCFSFQAMQSEIRREGQIGELFKISAAAVASQGEPLVPGRVLWASTASATGTGTAVQLGAVGTGQYLYAALHVLAKSGTSPTLTVKVQSDDNSGFTSATDRITLTQMTAEGTLWATRVAGPITDTYWRVSHTIGGTGSPTFNYVLVAGII